MPPHDPARAEAAKLGIRGTPSLFVNGRELPSPHPLVIEMVLREELRAAGVTALPADEMGIFPR